MREAEKPKPPVERKADEALADAAEVEVSLP